MMPPPAPLGLNEKPTTPEPPVPLAPWAPVLSPCTVEFSIDTLLLSRRIPPALPPLPPRPFSPLAALSPAPALPPAPPAPVVLALIVEPETWTVPLLQI